MSSAVSPGPLLARPVTQQVVRNHDEEALARKNYGAPNLLWANNSEHVQDASGNGREGRVFRFGMIGHYANLTLTNNYS